MNMGYPLLSESSLVDISSAKVVARNEAAEPEVDQWNKMIPPVANYDERCFYHTFEGEQATAKIYNPDVQKGLAISFDPRLLPVMCEWKMMGEKDYVLGLEPANNYLEGRKYLEENHMMTTLKAGGTFRNKITVTFFDKQADWEAAR